MSTAQALEDAEVLLAKPRGFCAGVDRAIAIVERALELHGAPDLRAPRDRAQQVRRRGPAGQGRGVRRGAGRGSRRRHRDLLAPTACRTTCAARPTTRGLKVFDATCPLVTKVHVEVAKMRAAGREIVMIGHEGHPEAEGTMGQSEAACTSSRPSRTWPRSRSTDPGRLAYVTQTTLSVDDCARIVTALKVRFPDDPGPEGRRHLLRDAEPPGRGEVHGARNATW